MSDKQAKDRQAIADLFDRWAIASRNKDIDAIIALYHADICSYDAVGPLQLNGISDYRAHWEKCLPKDAEMTIEMQTPNIRVSGHLGVAHLLIRCGMRDEDGTENSSWMRSSYQLEKRDGQWRIAHEHFSVPFDFENCQPQFGLEP
jgi:uncharacterized protein (TIGR02246 family)